MTEPANLVTMPSRQRRRRVDDSLIWRTVHYLDFPDSPWAPGGPTAAMVLDTREQRNCWTMFFHGDRAHPHGAALGLAYSDDLEHWHENG